MSRNPVRNVTVETSRDGVVTVLVETTLDLAYVWPYVRASHDVPASVRERHCVWQAPYGGKEVTSEEAKLLVTRDVSWRHDNGYVSSAKCVGGWVFGVLPSD